MSHTAVTSKLNVCELCEFVCGDIDIFMEFQSTLADELNIVGFYGMPSMASDPNLSIIRQLGLLVTSKSFFLS